jgi:hypothetical protein
MGIGALGKAADADIADIVQIEDWQQKNPYFGRFFKGSDPLYMPF